MSESPSHRPLILASGSPYRAALLQRLGVGFEQQSPGVDETRHHGESARDYVLRLARNKAAAGLAGHENRSVISIGSDQVCVNGDQILGKPGSADGIRDQLRRASGRTVSFLTAIAVQGNAGPDAHTAVVDDNVVFRELDAGTIERYIAAENPVDCAGGFRAEGLGITLFDAIHSSDPTALIGLPLITLSRLLRHHGIELP